MALNTRTHITLTSIALLLMSPLAYSLGIGSPLLKSNLGQPLVVDVLITDSQGYTIDDLRAERAPVEVYERLGGQDRDFVDGLSTELIEENGNLLVRITTKKPFKEPFFDMILQVKWPSGELNKQLTVLVDP